MGISLAIHGYLGITGLWFMSFSWKASTGTQQKQGIRGAGPLKASDSSAFFSAKEFQCWEDCLFERTLWWFPAKMAMTSCVHGGCKAQSASANVALIPVRSGVTTQASLPVKGLAPLRLSVWIRSWWILALCEDWFTGLANLRQIGQIDMDISICSLFGKWSAGVWSQIRALVTHQSWSILGYRSQFFRPQDQVRAISWHLSETGCSSDEQSVESFSIFWCSHPKT